MNCTMQFMVSGKLGYVLVHVKSNPQGIVFSKKYVAYVV